MSDRTKIEWSDASWNVVTGCDEVSSGCDNCYAKTFAERWRGTPGHYFEHGFDVQLRPDKLSLPLKWRKPRRIFVNSMSDLFHKDVPDEYILQVWKTMATATQHTFQILTKRHARMRAFVSRLAFVSATREERAAGITGRVPYLFDSIHENQRIGPVRPLENVWLGVSIENQAWADIRIPALLDTPAAVRFLSCEPLLGPLVLESWLHCPPQSGTGAGIPGLGWVIAGGESGHHARPVDPEWVRSVRDQCGAAGVAFLFKQWGGSNPKTGGRLLDGRTWDEFPAVAA